MPTLPLVDTHCHLLATLDDGPRTRADALAMCRMAYEDGIRHVAALAHQNDRYPHVTPERIRTAAEQLAAELRDASIPLSIHPTAEVMIDDELESRWKHGELLSVADRGEYLLMELPYQLFLDLRELVENLMDLGVRPILAHPERHPELLFSKTEIPDLVARGCLIQISAESITSPRTRKDIRHLKHWLRQRHIHLIGSDGHSPRLRPAKLGDAYRRIARWSDQATADRICSTNGLAVLKGLPLRIATAPPLLSKL